MDDRIDFLVEQAKYFWLGPLWEFKAAERISDLQAIKLRWNNPVENKYIQYLVPLIEIEQVRDFVAFIGFIQHKIQYMSSEIHDA